MGKRTFKQRDKYIHNFARTLMGRYCLTPGLIQGTSRDNVLNEIWCWGSTRVILSLLEKQSDEVLGRLAACGIEKSDNSLGRVRVSLDEISNRAWLTTGNSGYDRLYRLAVCAVFAAIVDNLYDDIGKALKKAA